MISNDQEETRKVNTSMRAMCPMVTTNQRGESRMLEKGEQPTYLLFQTPEMISSKKFKGLFSSSLL